jgi:hypothetical protein
VKTLLRLAVVAAVVTLIVAAVSAARTSTAPENSAPPTITGAALVEQTLTGGRGTWGGTPPIDYTYAWQRCDDDGGDCAAISGAGSTTYTVTSADLGSRLRLAVTAKNDDGDATARSDATAVVTTASGKPASTAPPSVSGSPNVGSTLTASTGRWTGDQPISYAYQWQTCDAQGNACSAIASEKSSTYLVVKKDVGHALRVQVTARNSRGSGKAISAPTDAAKDAGGGDGIVDIGGGKKSADVSSVVGGQRLVVQSVGFSPNPVRSRDQPIAATVTVTDTRGYYVRGAWVFIRSTPVLTQSVEDKETGADGKVAFSITPRADFPIKAGYSVQFFVKAYRKGDDTLAGVSGSRLVQVATAP